MLVLTRRQQETIVIDGRITVTIVKARGRMVQVGVDAPADIAVHRGEVFARIEGKDWERPAGAAAQSQESAERHRKGCNLLKRSRLSND